MKQCANCKKWDRENLDILEKGLGLGLCTNAKMLWDVTEWDGGYENRQFKEEFKNLSAFVQDGSDYRADLLTKPTFYCSDYEKTNNS